jgi:hypothetical protein
MTRAYGLTAAELAQVLRELQVELAGAVVKDTAWLREHGDLVVFARRDERSFALHIAPGGTRARVCLTRQRFPRTAFATGPWVDRTCELLVGRTLGPVTHEPHERRFGARWQRADAGDVVLEVELFGNRGLWCLTDTDGRLLVLSRLPDSKTRDLRVGAVYAPPPSAPPGGAPPSRFAAPWSIAVDRWFADQDRRANETRLRAELERALERAERRAEQRATGLERRAAATASAAELRTMADMLLAYGHSLAPGSRELRVPHPTAPDREVVVPLVPGKPPHAQADALYRKARKHADEATRRERDLAELVGQRARLAAHRAALATAADLVGLTAVGDAMARDGLGPDPAKPAAPSPRIRKITHGERFRRFVSAEGHLLLVGRTNEQNDRLTVRVARGNDLWFHVGLGYAGSHVVLRLPKGKSASLESLLDAATLAVHFSKARGAESMEVIYTAAKHVRKPKGLPPGKVAPSHTRSLRVRREPTRLARVLASAADDAAEP